MNHVNHDGVFSRARAISDGGKAARKGVYGRKQAPWEGLESRRWVFVVCEGLNTRRFTLLALALALPRCAGRGAGAGACPGEGEGTRKGRAHRRAPDVPRAPHGAPPYAREMTSNKPVWGVRAHLPKPHTKP